ncbi:MAG: FAD-dependent oxidoreductase [Verrucomicrobia subdivision 3 bacterium]|nr:FAD-dependent oxidoreductase [Limisphaerales bacterium]
MIEHAGVTRSIWMDSAALPVPTMLRSDLEAEVCIVGAGIAGLSTAYQLTRQGHRVIVLEDGPLASGETERTTAHLSNALDDRYCELERVHGETGARLAAESHSAAIDYIESTVLRERIDCEFERLDGYLFVPPGEPTHILDDELVAARRAGVPGVEIVNRAPLSSFNTGRALRFPRQGQFHPLKYLSALTGVIQRQGGRLFSHTHVDQIEDGAPCRVHTQTGYTVRADAVVVATNTPVNDRVSIHTKQAPYRTYVIGAPVPPFTVARALYWDTRDPYHYVRLQHWRGQDILVIGGEDHKTGQAEESEKRWTALADWARAHFPMMGDIAYRWSGQVMEPVDYLAFIGRNPVSRHIYIATGDSGHGMTHGTIAGMLLTDLIAGQDNPWTKLYDPSRKSLATTNEFARENLNVAARYTEWATGGDVKSADDLAPGCGAVIRHGLRKSAVFKDEDGTVHVFSAVCPHLRCIVHWNDAEKTWDCPCHGSRFDKYGTVLNGPAIKDLTPLGRAGARLTTKE